MGVKELREAFNSVAEPKATCSLATQGYERADGKEWQVLMFRGTTQDGGQFEVTSTRLPAKADLLQASRDAAHQLVDQENGQP